MEEIFLSITSGYNEEELLKNWKIYIFILNKYSTNWQLSNDIKILILRKYNTWRATVSLNIEIYNYFLPIYLFITSWCYCVLVVVQGVIFGYKYCIICYYLAHNYDTTGKYWSAISRRVLQSEVLSSKLDFTLRMRSFRTR